MAHKGVSEPSVWIPNITEWSAPDDAEIQRRRQSFSVVVYCPKYDTALREEATVNLTDDGKFQVEITKVGKNSRWSEDLGTFDTYEEAKASLYDRFDDLFNRPSKNAIEHGARPNWKVWDEDGDGNPRDPSSPPQQVKRSVSILEGDDARTIFGARVESVEMTPKGRKMKSYKIRVPDVGIPTTISVRTLYPSYFKSVSDLHVKRMARLKRYRSTKK
jgi:hypothetical protein